MPAVGWWLGGEETVSFEEAREIALREGSFEGWILPVLLAMERQAKEMRGLWISPSQALVCPRLRILEMVEPYYVRPDWVWAAMSGSAVHKVVAEVGMEGALHEVSLEVGIEVEMDGERHVFPVRGTADLYIPAEKRLVDIKTTSKKVLAPTLEHELQVNIYAWLLRENGMEVERAELWYVQQGLRDGKAARVLVPVQLLPHEEVTTLLEDLARPLLRYSLSGELPPCRCQGRPLVYPDLCAASSSESAA